MIPEDWEVKTIDAVCKLINGRGFKPFEWKDSGLPIIRIQNLNGSDEFNFYQGTYDKKLEVEPKQLLFAWSGSRGTSFGPHLWPGPLGLLNYHTWKVQIIESEVDKGFFLHTLRQLTGFIEGKAHGAAALVHTQKWEMESFQFPLPPTKVEQEAIAEALSDADALIESLDQLIAKKRHVKQGAMQELLTGRKRLPGFSGEWEVKKVREIGEVITGGTPPTQVKEYWLGTIPWVTPTDIDQTKDIFLTERQLTPKGLETIRELPPNSVLVTCIASIGKNAVLKFKGGCNQQINAVVPNHAKSADFLYYLFESSKQYLLNNAGITATSIISKKAFSELDFRLPQLDEQTAIATVFSDMDAEIAALEARLDKARQIKQGMMHNLLTGKIRLV